MEFSLTSNSMVTQSIKLIKSTIKVDITMRKKGDCSRRRRFGEDPQARFLACYRTVRLAYRNLQVERDVLIACTIKLYFRNEGTSR